MNVSESELTSKIRWACDLHAAQVEAFAQDLEKESGARKATKRATEQFTVSLLYVAIAVMWAAIALRIV
jgi:hypothetical protein